MSPRTGADSCLNILIAFRASSKATSCGVDTTNTPVSDVRWHSVSCTSPVPGGRSMTRMSSRPHLTCPSICWSAPISIGPRQITAWPGSTIKPIDIIVTPCALIGMIVFPSGDPGRWLTPIIFGSEGPWMSASRSPTRLPCRASATERLDAIVDFPTPPLPDATATIRSTPLIFFDPSCGVGWRPTLRLGGAGPFPAATEPCAVRTTETFSTPGRPDTLFSASARAASNPLAAAGLSASITNRTWPPSKLSALTRSELTRSPPSGSFTVDSTRRIL